MKITEKKVGCNHTTFEALKIGTWFIFNNIPLCKVSDTQYLNSFNNKITSIYYGSLRCTILKNYCLRTPLIRLCALKDDDMFTYCDEIWIKVNNDNCVCLSNELASLKHKTGQTIVTKINPNDLEIIY